MSRVTLSALLVAAAILFARPAGALGGTVLLSFGSSYERPDGGRATHRGVDLAAEPDARVASLVEGEVSFAGSVPRADGGTMLAVSVRRGDEVVTLLPLAKTAVAVGDQVSVGTDLGVLAPEGDASCERVHLHVGARRGTLYVDPAYLLSGPPAMETGNADASASEQPVTKTARATSPVNVATGAGAPASPRNHMPTSEEGVAGSTQPVLGAAVTDPACGSLALTGRPASAREVGPTHAAPQCSPLPSGVTLATQQASRPKAGVGAAALEPALRFMNACLDTPTGLGALGLALTGVLTLLGRRGLERRILSNPPVSDRFGSMLQHLRAGDTLCGLTSCSGLLPSQSRGRLAQRR